MKLLSFILILCCGCAATSAPNVETPPIFAVKSSSAQAAIIQKPMPQKLRIPWSNDPWLQSGSWVVVESDKPQGPFTFLAQTTHNWIDIPMTNQNRFFNYCRAEDYDPN